MLPNQPMALLIDITRCIGCRACIGGCLDAHQMKGDPEKITTLSSKALTAIAQKDAPFVRQLCRHCIDPSCASVCPVEAFKKTPTGPVVYDASRCMGCRYCMQACPFGVPKYEWDRAVPAVVKCDFCAPRQAQGKPTMCAEVCPAEATVYGTRAEMLAEARRRIAADPKTYTPQIYGEHEVGGTSMLFLSPVPFEQLGFRSDLANSPLPDLTHAALSKIPGIVTVGGAFLMGLWWITHRRDEVARYEAELKAMKEAESEVSRGAN